MIDPARLLGFAFAGADLLFEIDADGTIVFANGALGELGAEREDTLIGQRVEHFFVPQDAAKLLTLASALRGGDRVGPLRLTLTAGGGVSISMCRMPQNAGRISCTLLRTGGRSQQTVRRDRQTGLPAGDAFLDSLEKLAEDSDELALVSVPALPKLCEGLGAGESDKLMQRIGAAIRESGVKTSGRLSPSTFGAIARAMKGANPLGTAIRKALKDGGAGALAIEQTLVSMKGAGLSPEQRMLSVRYVADQFVGGSRSKSGAPVDLVSAFDALLKATHGRALALTQTVADGQFALAYQPIVDLKSGEVSHFEALARFESKESTGEIVGFAEALGIADAFDLAVLVKLIAELDKGMNAGVHVAFNVSGHTIMSPPAFGLLAGLLASRRELANNLLVEITETAEMTDLVAANAAIQVLREMGFQVGVDDFGAGAATLQYLHALTIDFVKVDGALIRKLGASARDDQMLAGIVKLCGELGVETIAEYIEDELRLKRARAIGFDFGQGHRFGAAIAELPAARDAATQSVGRLGKRKGVQERWG
jgi:EAL domain-containing protein (putative c-di-GMP-specific phosphodiesterase class I)